MGSKYTLFKPLHFVFVMALVFCVQALVAQTPASIIVQLKQEGVVLVRLNRQLPKIAALQKLGRTEEIATLEAAITLEHREIVISFKETFDFCTVLFFYAEHAATIAAQGPKGFLFDAAFLPVDLDPPFFIVADFNGSPEKGISGLAAYNQKMVPLAYPFPYFVRNHVLFYFWSRPKTEVISRWNKKLVQFYNRSL